jgi:hypothetical protein
MQIFHEKKSRRSTLASRTRASIMQSRNDLRWSAPMHADVGSDIRDQAQLAPRN